MSGRRRRRVEHTDDWQELLPLFDWPDWLPSPAMA
jgi:hypothetical protein